jgi:colanic acid biosynthesis glycosyl transferase WcaI
MTASAPSRNTLRDHGMQFAPCCGGMRILLYSANFAPEPTGIGKYSGEMARWLVDHGHDVRVVAAPPYYPEWKLDRAYAWPPYRREHWSGVEVFRAPLWVPHAPGGVSRVLHLLSFALTSFPVMLQQVAWRPDLVVTVAPAFLCAPTALLVARLCGARRWLHLQDFEVDIAFRMGLLRGALLQRLVLRMERWVLRRFDTVSTISHRMLEQLLNKGVDARRMRYLPNWVDISRIRPGASSAGRYREQLGIAPETTLVLFSGSLGGKQGLEVIPEVARRLAPRCDIAFLICGEGVMKAPLEAQCSGLANVHFLPLQPLERLGELLSSADIHLLPQSPGAADLVLPSKLSGMLASGRPVIATCLPGTELMSVVSKCGLVVAPEDAEAVTDAVVRLAQDPALRAELGRQARALAESMFERDAVLGRVFGPLEEVGQVVDDVLA